MLYRTPKNSLATETETREKTAPGGRREADKATGLMKDGDQTRKEVFTPMADLLTPNILSTSDAGMLEHYIRQEDWHRFSRKCTNISLLDIMGAR